MLETWLDDAMSFGRVSAGVVRLVHPAARAVVGLVAALAVLAFAVLVFGPLADQRAFSMAGVHDAGSSGFAGAPAKLAAGRAPASGPWPASALHANAAHIDRAGSRFGGVWPAQ